MNIINFIIVLSIVLLSIDLIYHQVVNGQNNESAKAKVDKLIEDTIRDKAFDQSYRAELIKRMQNTTCLTEAFELFTTQELVDTLKQCVIEGKIK